MAGGMTAAFQQATMQRVVRQSTADLTPSTVYVHLYTRTLSDAVTLATTGRCPGANYAPAAVTNSTATWTQPSSTSPSRTTNKVVIPFTTAASTGWGTIQGFTIATAASTDSGSILWWGDISPSQAVSAGNSVQFSTGDLVLLLGGGTAT